MCGLARNTWELMSTSANYSRLLDWTPKRAVTLVKDQGTVCFVFGFFDHGFPRRCLVHRHWQLVALSDDSSSTATRSIRIAKVVQIGVGVSGRHTLIFSLFDLSLLKVDGEFQSFSRNPTQSNRQGNVSSLLIGFVTASLLVTRQSSLWVLPLRSC